MHLEQNAERNVPLYDWGENANKVGVTTLFGYIYRALAARILERSPCAQVNQLHGYVGRGTPVSSLV